MPVSQSSSQEVAQVVTTFGRRVELRLESGNRVAARIKGRQLRAVCGDRVMAEPIERESDWLITDIRPRRNELTRPDSRGRKEVLAANLSLLVCVVAAQPKPDWYIVDRYLGAAELMDIKSAVVFNKQDLNAPNEEQSVELRAYADIGYPVLRTSAVEPQSIEPLQQLLTDEVAILVGQSGVGKSSLINQLAEGSTLRTGKISDKSGEGRHTTVNSSMLELAAGGAVIDSPGVRDYAPSIAEANQIVFGFPEIARAGRDCRYPNCRHLREPSCGVKSAVDAGDVLERRYDSYKRLVHLTESLKPGKG